MTDNAQSTGARVGRIHLDLVTLGIVSAILLLGLVMVTSASMSIASRGGGEPFAYLERQLVLVVFGCFAAALAFSVRTEVLERLALPMLAVSALLLLLVAIPGIGHMVNGSRRWLRVAGISIQVSEITRILVLVWVASYAVRREVELRSSLTGLLKPLGMLGLFVLLLLLEPDFGAAAVLPIAITSRVLVPVAISRVAEPDVSSRPEPRSTTPLAAIRSCPSISYVPASSSTAPRKPSSPGSRADTRSIARWISAVSSPSIGETTTFAGTSGGSTPPPS